MATIIKFTRGTTSQNDNYTGADGTLSIDNQKHTLRVHDGSKKGGYEIASTSMVSEIVNTEIDKVIPESPEDGVYPEESNLGKALNKKLDKTVTSDETNLNNMKKEGEFFCNAATADLPQGVTKPVHLSVRVTESNIYQTLTATVSGTNAIYVRVATDHLGTSWGDWNRIGSAGASGLTTVTSEETDLNNLKSDGEFNCTAVTTNLPEGVTKPVHLSVRATRGGALQVVYGKKETKEVAFIRSFNGSDWGTWSSFGDAGGIGDLIGGDTDWDGEISDNPLITGLDQRYIKVTEKGAHDGVATLDGSGKIPQAQLPDIAITSVKTAENDAGRDALKGSLQEGDVVIVTASESAGGQAASYILDGDKNFKVLGGAGAVLSVAGKTGAVTLEKTDVGLDKVQNLALSSAETDLAKLTEVTDGSYATPLTIKSFLEKCGWVFSEDDVTLGSKSME